MNRVKITIILMAAVLLVAGAAPAAPIQIGALADGLKEPSRVALDGQGNVYVSVPASNKVHKYNSKGEMVASLSVPRPYGIAVGPSGRLYVSSVRVPQRANNYVNHSAVLIFSPSMEKLGTLGAEKGEFEAPVDLEIDGSGDIYVADALKGAVRVYNAAGILVRTIGSGYLRGEQWTKAVAVSDTANNGAGEVYVIDSVKTTVQGYLVDAPRVTVFSKSGAQLRSFGQYGAELGKMMLPAGIAAGSGGKLYVADLGNNVVHVLNAADGTPAGEGGLYAPYAYRPADVCISRNNLAYVVWQTTGSNRSRVDLFALEGYVTMAATPASLLFEARQLSANPAAQTVIVANSGSGTLTWSATADQSWISLGQQTAVGPQGQTGLAVSVDASKLTAGMYQGKVTLAADYGQTVEVGVGLTVLQPLMLNISNWSPTFTSKKGMHTVSESVTVGIDGGAGGWSIAAATLPTWLSISPLSGGAAATTVTFTAKTDGLAAQEAPYTASVPVSAAGVIGDGGKFTVSLKINATTKINVSTNRSEATFQLSGPTAYSGSGTTWSVEDAPAGEYTATFGAVPGFRKPRAQTKALAKDGEVSFSGDYASYQDLAAKKNIITAKGPGAANDSRVKLYKNNGAPSDFDLVALETLSGATVAAGDVDGDGVADLIVGAGSGMNNPAGVRVYRAADKAVIAEFVPFGSLNGARVSSGDLNGDGRAEVLVGADDNNGTVAVYTLSEGRMTFSGIEIEGRSAAVADLAGDGRPAIIAAGDGGITVWQPGVDAAVGGWTAVRTAEHAVTASSVAAADLDADGREEIIVGSSGSGSTPSMVTVLRADGSRMGFAAFDKYGIAVAAADLDGDGKAEIVAAAGAKHGEIPAGGAALGKMNKRDDGKNKEVGPGNSDHEEGTVRVYSAAGALKFVVRPFDRMNNGVTVAVGDLGQ